MNMGFYKRINTLQRQIQTHTHNIKIGKGHIKRAVIGSQQRHNMVCLVAEATLELHKVRMELNTLMANRARPLLKVAV